MNLLLSRLDEQQRRWFAGLEALRAGRGGVRRVSRITGMDEKTVRRGRSELLDALDQRPLDRVRLPGGGRHPAKKPGS
jgi:hypothetical protein